MIALPLNFIETLALHKNPLYVELSHDDILIIYDYYGNVWEFINGGDGYDGDCKHYVFPLPSKIDKEILDKWVDFAYDELLMDISPNDLKQTHPTYWFHDYGKFVHYQKSLGIEDYVYQHKVEVY